MPYTYKSLALAWLIFFALFAMSASGAAGGWRLLLLLAAAFLVPAIVLRTRADAAATSSDRGIDVLKWEDEGGARRRPLRDGVRVPA
jgi:hypothetical protein